MQQKQPRYERVYVDVRVLFCKDGSMVPKALIWKDGHKYSIDRILDVRPAHADKAGGQGDRYTVLIEGYTRYLFYEQFPDTTQPKKGRWFVEGQKQ